MKLYYPAIFLKEEDGCFTVTFPNVEEAVTYGETIEHSIEMAKECLGLCLDVRKERGEEIPLPNFDNIKTEENEMVMVIEFDSLEWNRKYNKKSVRKSVTIPAWLNELAESKNVNFSNVLQNALLDQLKVF